MRPRHRLLTLTALLAIIAFMLGAVSCTGPAAQRYQLATGVTPGQTATLLMQLLGDYSTARATNAATRTEFDTLSDYTSAKAVLRGVSP
jgi:hypothetical protein